MRRLLLAGATTMAVVFSSQAIAQSATIELAPDQRTRIKEYVVKERVAPVTVKERVRVGATLPADVELRAVPSDWGPSVRKYKYIYSDNREHFVEPTTRRVIYDIDKERRLKKAARPSGRVVFVWWLILPISRISRLD